MFKLLRIFSGTVWLILLMSAAQPALADCCLCHPLTSLSTNVCLVDANSTCDKIISTNSSNKNLTGVVCEKKLDESTMAQKNTSDSASAICNIGPILAAGYAPEGSTTPAPVSSIQIDQNIPIPNLVYAKNIFNDNGFVSIPYLAQYISAVYAYLLGIGIIFAAIMVVYGGFKYVLAASIDGVKTGKEQITNGLIGLVVLISGVTILQTINPTVALPQALKLKYVMSEEALWQKYGTASEGPVPGSTPTPGKGNFKPIDNNCAEPSNPKGKGAYTRMMAACNGTSGTKDDLLKVVKTFKEEGIDNGGAIYVRGGVSGGSGLTIQGAQSEFMISSLKNNNLINDEVKNACGGDTDKAAQLNSPACRSILESRYGSYAGGIAACNDILATDCGYFVSQVLKCANMKGFNSSYRADAYTFRNSVHSFFGGQEMAELDTGSTLVNGNGKIQIWKAIDTKDPIFSSISNKVYFKTNNIVPRKICEEHPDKCKLAHEYDGGKAKVTEIPALAASGKIRFGAVMMMCDSEKARCGHFFLYVGGAGLGYDTIESGGTGGTTGEKPSIVTFKNYKPSSEGSTDKANDTFASGTKIVDTIQHYVDRLDKNSLIYWANSL